VKVAFLTQAKTYEYMHNTNDMLDSEAEREKDLANTLDTQYNSAADPRFILSVLVRPSTPCKGVLHSIITSSYSLGAFNVSLGNLPGAYGTRYCEELQAVLTASVAQQLCQTSILSMLADEQLEATVLAIASMEGFRAVHSRPVPSGICL
jgi:hypothetical protein